MNLHIFCLSFKIIIQKFENCILLIQKIMVITNIITPIMANNMLMSCTKSLNFSETSDKQEPISHDLSFDGVNYSYKNIPNNIINIPLTERYINMYRENRISINNISTPVKTFRTKKINNNNRRNHIIHQPSGANCSQRR